MCSHMAKNSRAASQNTRAARPGRAAAGGGRWAAAGGGGGSGTAGRSLYRRAAGWERSGALSQVLAGRVRLVLRALVGVVVRHRSGLVLDRELLVDGLRVRPPSPETAGQ